MQFILVYKYYELQVSFATQKLSYKASCKIPSLLQCDDINDLFKCSKVSMRKASGMRGIVKIRQDLLAKMSVKRRSL
jgi:hypothetical protein